MILVDLALFAALAAIAVADFRSFRIPDLLSLPLTVAGLAWAAAASPQAWSAHLLGALAGYASLAGFGALYFRWRGREGLGLGDAKLLAAAGAWLGWRALPSVVLIAAVAGIAFAVATRAASGDRRLAFGPWLCLGFWAIWLTRT